MLEFLYWLIVGTVLVLFLGYMTPKFAIYGSITTGLLWLMGFVVPAFTPSEVASTMGPRIVDLFLAYPTAIGGAHSEMVAMHGWVGGVVTLAVGVVLFVPYALGLVLGITTWPELILLRLFA